MRNSIRLVPIEIQEKCTKEFLLKFKKDYLKIDKVDIVIFLEYFVSKN